MSHQRVVKSEFMAKIGVRVRVLRFERGLSMRSLAQLAGCSADCILQIEMGRSSITTKILCKLARALKVEPFDLLNHDTQNDDLGYVVEMMRHDPEVLRLVSARLARMKMPAVPRSGSSVPAEC